MRNHIRSTKGIRFGKVPGGLPIWMFSLALLLSSSLGLAGWAFSGAAAQKLSDRYAEENGLDAAPPDAPKVFLSRPQGSAGMLLIPESTNDRVMLFDSFDGSLINAAFITSAGELSTPINAIVANGEIWVSDQITDDIIRYDLTTGALLGPLVNTGLDNIRGMDFINGTLFVTNAGTANGAPGEAIVKFDSSGNNLGSFPSLGSPFDVFPRNSELLVADIDADRIERFSTTGTDLGTFASGMDFPEQISRRSNGNYLIANFSGSTNDIVELDTNGGFVRAFDLVSGERGVFELGNGKFIYTNGNGVHILNPNDGTSVPVITGVSGRFIEAIPAGQPGDCTITCPNNITQSNDPNQCGAVVNYPAPTTSGTCGTITCSPASGSFFPVGTTTVTCTETDPALITATTVYSSEITRSVLGVGTTCSFSVTVIDTQPPTITCPVNVTAVTNQNVCPAPACQVVNFPPPTTSDNCPGVTVACNPPSGSCFPVGVTTVTCTATDASGNTATCSFTVTTFDTALQDDSDPSIILLWNSITGQYRFCCKGVTYTGVGKSTIHGCVFTLQHNPAVWRVLGRVDKAVHTGTASIQAPPGTTRCTITDRDTLNDTLLPACQ